MQISERLQSLRKLKNYSQEDLAEMLGVSRQAVSKWESDQANPDINNIIKLREIYSVSTDYILMGKEEKPSKVRSHTYKKALAVISIIGATALITVLFIVTLGIFEKNYLAG